MKNIAAPQGAGRKSDESAHCAHCSSRGKGIFCSASSSLTHLLDKFKTVHDYRKGQAIFYEGTPATGVYCVSTGSVKLFKSAATGREEIIGIADPGDVLGYASLFTDRPLSVSAEAMEDSRVCFIEKEGFRAAAAQEPTILANMVKELSQELEAVEDRLLDQVDKPAPVRMARLLLALKETHGRQVPGGVRLGVDFSRLELAEMIGTTQETAIRLLSRFKARGFIRLDKRSIIITSPDGLLKAAKLPLDTTR